MQEQNKLEEIKTQDQKIIQNKELSMWEAMIPVLALIGVLAFNVFVYGDDALSGSNQFVLLIGAGVAAIVGFRNKVSYEKMIEEVAENIKSTVGAILILLMVVGSLAGTWLISGIIPSMIYYGLQILNPTIFLAACLIICAIISIATGSSWTTSATVGIALVGIGEVLGISMGMTAGAVLSGAYFGDKMFSNVRYHKLGSRNGWSRIVFAYTIYGNYYGANHIDYIIVFYNLRICSRYHR